MTEPRPIRIVGGSWTHTCLRIPGYDGRPTKIHLEGVGACIYCGDPGPEKQAEIDRQSVELLRSKT